MAEISFYHATRQPPLQALARLMEKVHAQSLRGVIRARDEDRVREIDSYLWTYNPASFLPHGTPATSRPEAQPLYITTGDENPNGATVLVLMDNVLPEDVNGFDRVLYLFDGQDEAQTATAREHWRHFRQASHSLTYWEQQDGGGWKRAA